VAKTQETKEEPVKNNESHRSFCAARNLDAPDQERPGDPPRCWPSFPSLPLQSSPWQHSRGSKG
jgi:hypothetical protein